MNHKGTAPAKDKEKCFFVLGGSLLFRGFCDSLLRGDDGSLEFCIILPPMMLHGSLMSPLRNCP